MLHLISVFFFNLYVLIILLYRFLIYIHYISFFYLYAVGTLLFHNLNTCTLLDTTVCNLYALIMVPFYLHVIYVLIMLFFCLFVIYVSELYVVLFVLYVQ